MDTLLVRIIDKKQMKYKCRFCHGQGAVKNFIDETFLNFDCVCTICKKGYWKFGDFTEDILITNNYH